MYKYVQLDYSDIYHIQEFMSGLDKITSFNDIESLVRTDPVEVSPHHSTKSRTKEHNEKISESCKKFYETDEGKEVLEKRAKRMSDFYDTRHGQAIRKKSSAKCGRPKPKAIARAVRQHIANEYSNGKKISELAKHYEVSRASIYRYIREFT